MRVVKGGAIAFILGYIAAFYMWLIAFEEHAYLRTLGTNLFILAGMAIGLVWHARAYLSIKTEQRTFWLLMAIAYGLYILAQCTWVYYQLVLRVKTPYPGPADYLWLVEYVVVLGALVYLMSVIRVSFQKQFLFNLTMFMVVATTLSVHFLMRPILSRGALGPPEYVSLAYTVLNLCFLFACLHLHYMARGHALRRLITLLTFGFLLQIVADSFYSFLNVQGRYEPGSFFDPFWVFTNLSIGYAALYAVERQQTISPQASAERPLRLSVFPLLSVVALILLSFREEHRHPGALDVGAFVTILLVIVRKLAIETENRQLVETLRRAASELEGKVRERTVELEQKNEELRLGELRYRQLIELLPNFVLVHRRGNIVFVNATGAELLGARSAEQVLGKSVFDFIPKRYAAQAKSRMIDAESRREPLPKVVYELERLNKATIYVEVSTLPILFGGEPAVLVVGHDITERKRNEERIEYLAYHDPLTGLRNRIRFQESIELELRAAAESGRKVALLFIDLDGFKSVNDTFGHMSGDLLLISVAERVRRGAEDAGATAYRLGGDEFTVVLPDYTEEKCLRLMRVLLEDVAAPHAVRGERIGVTPSIGVSVYPDDGETVEELLKTADAAMYAAKEKGKRNFSFFRAEGRQDA